MQKVEVQEHGGKDTPDLALCYQRIILRSRIEQYAGIDIPKTLQPACLCYT